jgi:hypothetical protein
MGNFEAQARSYAASSLKYYVALEKAKKLLEVAKCPNAHCVDGVVQEGFPDECVFECQFCAERKVLLADRI